MHDFKWIEWNLDKIARHNVSWEEAEYVVEHPLRGYPRRALGKRQVWGRTPAGEYVIEPDDRVFIIHARPLTDSEKRSRQAPEKTMTQKTKRRRTTSSKRNRMFYSELSPKELDKLAEPFEREFVPSKPLTPAMRAQERRARRKRGRPVVAQEAQKVLISVERGLLNRADEYARKHNKNRSQVIAECLREVLFPSQKRRAS